MLPDTLEIPIQLLEGEHQNVLRAQGIRHQGFFLCTDTPRAKGELVRIRVPTDDDPPPLRLLAVVIERIDTVEAHAMQRAPGMQLQLYGLSPYTRTRWHRWLTTLDDRWRALSVRACREGASFDEAEASATDALCGALFTRAHNPTRRRHARYRVAWPLRLAHPEGEVEVSETLDLSVGGARVLSAREMSPGDRLSMTLHRPQGGARLTVEVEVVRRVEQPSPPHHFGVRFMPTDDDEEARLHRFIFTGLPAALREGIAGNMVSDDPLMECI